MHLIFQVAGVCIFVNVIPCDDGSGRGFRSIAQQTFHCIWVASTCASHNSIFSGTAPHSYGLVQQVHELLAVVCPTGNMQLVPAVPTFTQACKQV